MGMADVLNFMWQFIQVLFCIGVAIVMIFIIVVIVIEAIKGIVRSLIERGEKK